MTSYETTQVEGANRSNVSQVRGWAKSRIRRADVAMWGECVAPRQTGARWNFDLAYVNAKDVEFLSCTIWESQAPKIDLELRKMGLSLEQAMTTGMALKLTGTTWLGKDGKLYVTVTAIEPELVRRGSLYLEDMRAMDAMKVAGVASERLCDSFTHDNPKSALQTLGRSPVRIMVLGPEGAQGIGDFRRRLRHNRTPSPHVVYRALSWTLAENIQTVKTHLDDAYLQNVDLVLFVQGGGHWSVLRGYERKDLALAIHSSRVPVATAVGHDANVSLADRAAKLSFITPTAAAEAIGNALDYQHYKQRNAVREAAGQKKRKADLAARTVERETFRDKTKNLETKVNDLERSLAKALQDTDLAQTQRTAEVHRANCIHTQDLLELASRRVRFNSRLATAATLIGVAVLIAGTHEVMGLLRIDRGPAEQWLYATSLALLGAALVLKQLVARRNITRPSAAPMKRPPANAYTWRFAVKRVHTIRGLRKLRHHTPL
jgi:exonuclease VII large subunit